MIKNEWNNVVKYCKKNDISPEQLTLLCVKTVEEGYRTRFLRERFDLYAKERIKQKSKNTNIIYGSKKEAVRNVVASKEFSKEFSKVPRDFKHDQVKILCQLISEPRQRLVLSAAFIQKPAQWRIR